VGSLGTGDGQFINPWGVACDGNDDVYVTDAGLSRIQKFNASGTFITKWGSQGSGDGQFLSPTGIACDGSGNIYIVDFGNHRIQKFK
jgi:DNA-binding beta-propeller fold protein YncE